METTWFSWARIQRAAFSLSGLRLRNNKCPEVWSRTAFPVSQCFARPIDFDFSRAMGRSAYCRRARGRHRFLGIERACPGGSGCGQHRNFLIRRSGCGLAAPLNITPDGTLSRDHRMGCFSLCLTLASMRPTPSIRAATRSPALILAPFGQPVEIRSPGWSVM
jgi:hypothetical protein